MTPPAPLSAPRALRVAVGFAFASMVASLVQSAMLLMVRALFEAERGNEAWEVEGEDFSAIVVITIVLSTLVAIGLAASAVMTMTMSSQVGRIMLFVAAGIAIVWNLGCGCVFSAAWSTGFESDPNAGAQFYRSWQFTTGILVGFVAGIASVISVIVLAQRSVTNYFRALRYRY